MTDDVAQLLALKAGSTDSALASWVADGSTLTGHMAHRSHSHVTGESTSPCDAAPFHNFETGWSRVQCDAAGGRVSHISLGCDVTPTLTGDATELASLSALIYLNVNDCELVTGDIAGFATTECQSAHLMALYLQRTADSGDIAGLSQCTGLQQLSLVGTAAYGDPVGLRAFLGSAWEEFDACASLSGCPTGTINPIAGYIGGDLVTCCVVQCDLFRFTADTHNKPGSLALFSQAGCCDADSCSGNAAASDDWTCTAGSVIDTAATTIGASDATCCLLTCTNNSPLDLISALAPPASRPALLRSSATQLLTAAPRLRHHRCRILGTDAGVDGAGRGRRSGCASQRLQILREGVAVWIQYECVCCTPAAGRLH